MGANNEPKINMENLKNLLKEIKANHNDKNTREKSAKVVLGPSVLLPFGKGTKDEIRKVLSKITIIGLKKYKTQAGFKEMFYKQATKIAKILRKGIIIKKNKKSCLGAHAPKILSLYLRDLLVSSRGSITRKEFNRVEKLLYVPIDGKIIKKLNKLEFTLFKKKKKKIEAMVGITEIKTFFETQKAIARYIKKLRINMPRVWFDDVWIMNN